MTWEASFPHLCRMNVTTSASGSPEKRQANEGIASCAGIDAVRGVVAPATGAMLLGRKAHRPIDSFGFMETPLAGTPRQVNLHCDAGSVRREADAAASPRWGTPTELLITHREP
jgi:hypothetical protein